MSHQASDLSTRDTRAIETIDLTGPKAVTVVDLTGLDDDQPSTSAEAGKPVLLALPAETLDQILGEIFSVTIRIDVDIVRMHLPWSFDSGAIDSFQSLLHTNSVLSRAAVHVLYTHSTFELVIENGNARERVRPVSSAHQCRELQTHPNDAPQGDLRHSHTRSRQNDERLSQARWDGLEEPQNLPLFKLDGG